MKKFDADLNKKWCGKTIETIGLFQIKKVWIEEKGKRVPGTTAYAITEHDEDGYERCAYGDFSTLNEARKVLNEHF